jgi:hypothetical protein
VVKLGEFKVQVRQKEAISDLAQLLHMANCTYVVQRFSWRPSWQRTHMLRSFRWSRRNTPPPPPDCVLCRCCGAPQDNAFSCLFCGTTTTQLRRCTILWWGMGGGFVT